MQLDPRRTQPDCSPCLFEPAVVWIGPAQRDESSLRLIGRGKHVVVGGAIGAGLCEREHNGLGVDNAEDLSQLIGSEAGAVRIGARCVWQSKIRTPASRSCRQENHGSSSRSAATAPATSRFAGCVSIASTAT